MIDGESDDSSIDLFDQYIEYDPDRDQSENSDHTENKENIHEKCVDKPKKAKKNQFLLINDFMNENDEKSIGKIEYGRKWLTLCDALNEAGPPKYTPHKWKTKWTSHLYNVKKRRRSSKDLNHGNRPKILCEDKHTSSRMDNTNLTLVSHGHLSRSTKVETISFIYDQDQTSGIANNSRISRCDPPRSINFETVSYVSDQNEPSAPANNSDINHGESFGSAKDNKSTAPVSTPPFCYENLASSSFHGHHDDSNVSGMLKEDAIILGQNAIVNRLDLVIKRLDKSNDLLEELVKGKK